MIQAFRQWRIRKALEKASAVLWNNGIDHDLAIALAQLADGQQPAQICGFIPWMREVKIVASLLGWTEVAINSIDQAAWKEAYYDQGYSPAEAWREEYESA